MNVPYITGFNSCQNIGFMINEAKIWGAATFMIQMDGVKVSIFSSFVAQFFSQESTIAYFDNIGNGHEMRVFFRKYSK